MYFLVVRQKFTANVVVGLLGNESSDSNRFTLVTPKPENGVRLQATLGNQNPTGLPVRAVRVSVLYYFIIPSNGIIVCLYFTTFSLEVQLSIALSIFL